MTTPKLWLLWLVLSLTLALPIGLELFAQSQKPHFLPGETSAGHYQIELECTACHTEPFSDREVVQAACVNCHGEELDRAQDSHPKSKFTDPRNADRIARLDARYCASCHVEHRPDATHPMGVTLPGDFCFHCHQDIAKERPSHEGMAFATCADAGCHNFHDNRALYEDFLLTHADEPFLRRVTRLPRPVDLEGMLKAAGVDWETTNPKRPPGQDPREWQAAHAEWAASGHAEAGVGCGNCHQGGNSQQPNWIARPSTDVCGDCHQREKAGFESGKHGMRLARGLSPMTPGQARLPMKPEAAHLELTCNSCHRPHPQDTRHAAVEACLGCHDDDHSRAYPGSPHHATWEAFLAGEKSRSEAVSCATCHLPRINVAEHGDPVWRVEHNQNATLRPNEKMARTSCLHCHGLEATLSALADPALILTNFRGTPDLSVPSIDMAVERDAKAHSPTSKGETP